MHVACEILKGDPEVAERDVPAAVETIHGMLFREADVEPDGAVRDTRARFVERRCLHDGFLDQLDEILFRQTCELAVRDHLHRRVALRIRHERFFAETRARPELRELDRLLVADAAQHLAAAGLDRVVIIAGSALLDDDVTRLELHGFERLEELLDVRRRYMGEQIRLQHVREPVARLRVVDFLDLDRGDATVGRRLDAEQPIEQPAVDPQDFQARPRSRGHLARLQLCERMERCRLAAGHALDQLVVGVQLDLTLDDVERMVVAIPLPEQMLLLPDVEHLRGAEHLLLLRGFEVVDGNEQAEA